MNKYLHQKHFSLEEARETLRMHEAYIREMSHLARHLEAAGYDIYRHTYFGGFGPNGEKAHPPELERLVEILKIFESAGIQVKGLAEGLIDFPHIRENGEEVYLCYLLGEDELNFWHSLKGGFAGRQPVELL